MFLDTTNLHKEFLAQPDKSETDINQLLYLYETTLEVLADRISSSLTDYDMYQLIVGPVVMTLVSFAVLKVNVKHHIFMIQQIRRVFDDN